MSLEDRLQLWSVGPSATEEERCDNAESAVRQAIANDPVLSAGSVLVILQGSNKARTNVKTDSDVDLRVVDTMSYFTNIPDGMTNADFGLVTVSGLFPQYRDQVEAALVRHFGRTVVTPGDKAFRVRQTANRVRADVLPAFEYRQYLGTWDAFGNPRFARGVAFLARSGGIRIVNWPDHAHENGQKKHEDTLRKYRKHVRIAKRLRGAMEDAGRLTAGSVPSFPLESLIWNVPDIAFSGTFTAGAKAVLAHAWNATLPDGDHAALKEVNGIKSIFGGHQTWTPAQANSFLLAAWNFLDTLT